MPRKPTTQGNPAPRLNARCLVPWFAPLSGARRSVACWELWLPSFCGMRFLLSPTPTAKYNEKRWSQSPARRMPCAVAVMVNGLPGGGSDL